MLVVLQRLENVGTRRSVTNAGFDNDAGAQRADHGIDGFAIESRRGAETVASKLAELRAPASYPCTGSEALALFDERPRVDVENVRYEALGDFAFLATAEPR